MAKRKRKLVIHNVCKHCGCIEARACEGGCCWIDKERTICSRCLEIAVQRAIESLGFRQSLVNQAYVRSWLEEQSGWVVAQAIKAEKVKRKSPSPLTPSS